MMVEKGIQHPVSVWHEVPEVIKMDEEWGMGYEPELYNKQEMSLIKQWRKDYAQFMYYSINIPKQSGLSELWELGMENEV